MRVFLTGASGFVGSHIAEQLIAKGHEVMCTHRDSSNLWRCKPFINDIQWVLTDHQLWEEKIINYRPQAIIHSAWDGVDASGRDIWKKQIANLELQQTLLDIAVNSQCEKFIGIGSQAEYGTFSGCINEEYPPHPNTAYGAVKLAALILMQSFCELNKISWYWFRLFSCFGEREGDKWLIPATIKNMKTTTSMDFTAGEQQYAYLYIGEVAKAITASISSSSHSGIYNISSSHVISIRELLEKIRDKVNSNFVLNFGKLPYRPGQAMWMQGDNSKLNQNIYDINSSDFEKRLDQTIKYYIRQYE